MAFTTFNMNDGIPEQMWFQDLALYRISKKIKIAFEIFWPLFFSVSKWPESNGMALGYLGYEVQFSADLGVNSTWLPKQICKSAGQQAVNRENSKFKNCHWFDNLHGLQPVN